MKLYDAISKLPRLIDPEYSRAAQTDAVRVSCAVSSRSGSAPTIRMRGEDPCVSMTVSRWRRGTEHTWAIAFGNRCVDLQCNRVDRHSIGRLDSSNVGPAAPFARGLKDLTFCVPQFCMLRVPYKGMCESLCAPERGCPARVEM